MQEGSFRCDANVSVRRLGDTQLGTRCEIKNLNSFRFMERAIEYEAQRQIEIIEDGGKIVQETRLYDPDKDETRSMRSKEDAQDYRYFPDPDLLPLVIHQEWIDEIEKHMPELPDLVRQRFMSTYGLSSQDADALAVDRDTAEYFALLAKGSSADPKLCANWVIGDLASALNESGLEIKDSKISSEKLAGLMHRIADGTISGKMAKGVFSAMWDEGKDADAIIDARGLKQISDTGALEKIVDEIIANNAGQVAEYRAGKEKVFGFFVGQAMKLSQGKANPQQLHELLKQKLSA